MKKNIDFKLKINQASSRTLVLEVLALQLNNKVSQQYHKMLDQRDLFFQQFADMNQFQVKSSSLKINKQS
ncbi:unnamed protein product [Paramecium sonneborni]|uniref:Uncharacterized protein n=1 Tax=Paramecium sonneborni TaxID=65129 RepID=A0A8S1LA37_9CILI|nr:unnamed protein product [Paramecium sonneborni]